MQIMKITYNKIFLVAAFFLGLGIFAHGLWGDEAAVDGGKAEEKQVEEAQMSEIDRLLQNRKNEFLEDGEHADIFGDDNKVSILLLGLDSRAGQKSGHCDAIQLFNIDREADTVSITAVPRGTYSPLPPGGPLRPTSSYYVSNACGIGGLEYGINQIQKILGQKADYIVVVGFSETLGILRKFKLPTMDTLQWLRHRKGYSIGEPQRAHNHSTFLKHLMVKYAPTDVSKIDTMFHYLLYKIVETDLSFPQARGLITELSQMELETHPERVTLLMRPRYPVQDIAYDPEHLEEQLQSVLDPIKHLLSPEDFKEITEQSAEDRIVKIIEKKKDDPIFVDWAFKNDLWLQIDNDEKRENARYDLMMKYIAKLSNKEEKEKILEDYILEMEQTGMKERGDKARVLLEALIAKVE